MEINQTINCAFCQKKLLNIIVRDDKIEKVKVLVSCPFCNGHSKMMEFIGRVWYGPIGQDESNYPTIIKRIDPMDTHWQIEVIKK